MDNLVSKVAGAAVGRRTGAALVLALALSWSASAGAVEATAEQRSACTPDVFRLCSSEIPNVNRIIACLDRKRPELSPNCRAVFNPPAKTATRTLSQPQIDWCVFRGEETGQEAWQTWCGSVSRKP